jgi:hypothetical protein
MSPKANAASSLSATHWKKTQAPTKGMPKR